MNDYVASMRQKIGNAPLLLVGCGVIIEDQNGRILLQKRKSGGWGVPGGFIELGETYIEAATREVYEETGLQIVHPELFGIYSGKSCYGEYPNGDQIFSLQVVFYTNQFKGELKIKDSESELQVFFGRDEMPDDIASHHQRHIQDWLQNKKRPIVD